MIYAVLFPTNGAKNKTANKNKLNVNIVLLKNTKTRYFHIFQHDKNKLRDIFLLENRDVK